MNTVTFAEFSAATEHLNNLPSFEEPAEAQENALEEWLLESRMDRNSRSTFFVPRHLGTQGVIPTQIATALDTRRLSQPQFIDMGLDREISELVEKLKTICAVNEPAAIKRFLHSNPDIMSFVWEAALAASNTQSVCNLKLFSETDPETDKANLLLTVYLDSDDMDHWDDVEDSILDAAFTPKAQINRSRLVLSIAHIDEF